ncbi:hypothetical protein D5S17_36080 [Pseudonocardiaceae bacterium YIM PH 21723]|nr:hypothetical protein D5S17_36080 [Pseudonocardiaceae bacterium YIM PH 21723]
MTAPQPAVADSNDSGRGVPSRGLWLIERELLVALVHDPARISDVYWWLAGHDFADQQHGAVYDTIVRLYEVEDLRSTDPERGLDAHAIQMAFTHNAMSVRRALEENLFNRVPFDDPHKYVSDLFTFSDPAQPVSPRLHGQAVLGMSIKRQVSEWGVSLKRAAEAKPMGPGGVSALLGMHAAMEGRLEELADELRISSGQEALRSDQNSIAPIPFESAGPLSAKAVERAERKIIHWMFAGDPAPGVPGQFQRQELLARFQPEDFVLRAHQVTWRAIQTAAGMGQSITPGSVGWHIDEMEVERKYGEVEDGFDLGLDYEELLYMSNHEPADISEAVPTVLRSAITRLAEQARQEIRATAEDPQADVQDVLEEARETGAELKVATERLGGPLPAADPARAPGRLAGEREFTMSPQQGDAGRARTR